jgi:hypothetical protein
LSRSQTKNASEDSLASAALLPSESAGPLALNEYLTPWLVAVSAADT